MFIFEKERERQSANRGRAKRERDTESEVTSGSEFSAQSLMEGLNSRTTRL